MTSEDRGVTRSEQTYLKENGQPPEALGVEVIKHGHSVAARWHEAVDAREPVTVPLLPPDFYRSAQPVVVASLNGGRPLTLVLDTGAPVNLVHASVARMNHVRIVDPQKMGDLYRGLGGDEQTYYGMIDRLGLGPLHFRNVFTAVRTRVYVRKLAGALPVFRWEGNLIGMTTLTRFSYLTIDYRRGQATLAAREFFSETNGVHVCPIPFQLESMQVVADLRVAGAGTSKAIIDTGSDAGLMLSEGLVKRWGFEDRAGQGKPGRYVGLGGEMVTHTFVLPEMELGGTTFTNVTAVAVPADYPITVGSGFLKHYKATFDFRRKTLWLDR